VPFKSKAQQRFMFSEHPRIAERWADHTPDMKDLPDKVKKAAEKVGYRAINPTTGKPFQSAEEVWAEIERQKDMLRRGIKAPPIQRVKTAGYWDMMLKWAAVDPTIASHVKRVAKRMGYASPSDADIEGMFPKGWEKSSPSWQSQFEKSEWLKDQNTAKAYAKDVRSGKARPSSSWTRGPGWKSQPKNVAYRVVTSPLYPLGGLAAAYGGAVRAKSLRRSLKKRKHKRSVIDEAMRPVGKGSLRGAGIGALLGAALPVLALRKSPMLREPGKWKSLIGPSLQSALFGSGYGSGIGTAVGTSIARRRAQEQGLLKKSEEESAIPDRYFTKRLALPGAGAGALSGALDPAMKVVIERLEGFKNTGNTPSAKTLFSRMPKGTLRKSLAGAGKGAVGGLLSGYFTGRVVDALVQKKLKESAE